MLVVESAGLLALTALSLFLRTRKLGVHFWIDEGLSVGISSHPLTDIPHVLRLDGSPPLYYLLLHVWMQVAGTSEVATHWLSLIFALLCIPVAFWAGAALFDRRVAWTLAALAALCPFLTSYAQETRMYSLVALLSLVSTTCFALAFLRGRTAYRIPFGIGYAALLYTHNWALFLGVAYAIVLAIVWWNADREGRRALVRDVAIAFGTALVLYLPWLPTFAFQAAHTGAPWATPPSIHTLIRAPSMLLGGDTGTVVVLLAGGAGLAAIARDGDRDRRVLVPALVVLALVPILVAWLASHVSPAWATRYLAVAVAPLLILAAVGLRRAGRLGMVGLALLVVTWALDGAPAAKSNAHYVADTLGPRLHNGDLVISTQPEQLPVMHYYLPHDVRLTYATPFGVQRDLGVTDWRDGPAHFDRTGVDTQLMPELARLRPGRQVLLVVPIVWKESHWTAPWSSRVWARSIEYEGVLRGDPRFQLTAIVPTQFRSPGPNPVQGLLFRKVRNGVAP